MVETLIPQREYESKCDNDIKVFSGFFMLLLLLFKSWFIFVKGALSRLVYPLREHHNESIVPTLSWGPSLEQP